MKTFIAVFLAIVAGGLVLYLINISTIDTQLEIAEEAAQRYVEKKQERQKQEKSEQDKKEAEFARLRALDACNRKVQDEFNSQIRSENVVRNTDSFVAFNLIDSSGGSIHFRCIVNREFKVTSLTKAS